MKNKELQNKFMELGDDIIRAQNKCAKLHKPWDEACNELYKLEKERHEIWKKLMES